MHGIAALIEAHRDLVFPPLQQRGRSVMVLEIDDHGRSQKLRSPAFRLEVLRPKTCVFGDPGQHARSNLFSIVEGKHIIGRSWSRQRPMRAGLAFRCPTDAFERTKHAARSLLSPASWSRREKFASFRRNWFSALDAIGNNAQRKRFCPQARFRLRTAIGHYSRKIRYLRN